jgi:hypothetical protein
VLLAQGLQHEDDRGRAPAHRGEEGQALVELRHEQDEEGGSGDESQCADHEEIAVHRISPVPAT